MNTIVERDVSINILSKLVISIIIYIVNCALAVFIIFNIGLAHIVESKTFTGGISIILVIPSILYLRKYYKPTFACKISKGAIAITITVGIIASALFNYPYKIISGEHNKPVHYYYFVEQDQLGKFIYLLFLVVIAPVIEEIFDRYYLYNIIKDRYGVKFGVILSSIIFMALHGKIDVGLFIAGVMFALVYEKTKVIWASMIVHGATNLLWFSLIYYA